MTVISHANESLAHVGRSTEAVAPIRPTEPAWDASRCANTLLPETTRSSLLLSVSQLLYSAGIPQLSGIALIGVAAGQRPDFQKTSVSTINYTILFPLLLLLGNICAAVCYALSGDWKRALYWAASAVCIAAITF